MAAARSSSSSTNRIRSGIRDRARQADGKERRRFHLFFIPLAASSAHPSHPDLLRNRILRLAASTSVLTAGLLTLPTATPVALAHVGHGDEFQQQGEARQVKRNADSDALLGVATARPEPGPDGLTVPTTALVNAKGKPLLFVQTETTYDPVYVQTGADQGDRVVVTEGLDPTDVVVSSGALSLYAESLKTQQAEPAASDAKPAEAPAATTAGSSTVPVAAVAAGAVVVVAGGAIWLSRRRKTNA
jgi:cation efflux system membrane fusion protein